MQVDQILLFFARYIESELGIVYAEHNFFQLQTRLEEICKFLGVADLQKLFEQAQLGISGNFKQLLLDVATNNETYFFRDPKLFRAIEEIILPSLSGLGVPVRIWSAASSTGQEAISISITISEWKQKTAKELEFSITGTDVSERALEKANKAQYTQLEIQRGLPTTMLIKYFSKMGAGDSKDIWFPKDFLTQNTKFIHLNLLSPFQFPMPFHFVLCRNVLIYQNVERKMKILEKISASMAPGGFLVLGSSETLLGLSSDFDSVQFEGAIVYQKKAESG